MLCGEPAPLSVIVTAAFSAPAAVGAKCPWMVQLAPTVRLVPQVLAKTNEDAFAPVTAMLVIANAAVPVLVMVTDCDPLDVPTVVEGYDRLVAESVTGGSTPAPLSAILCGELLALSVMAMAAVNAPVVAGAKWPWMVQFAPAAKVAPQVFAKTNEDASAPVKAMLVIDKVAVPVLVIVTEWDMLEDPTVVAG